MRETHCVCVHKSIKCLPNFIIFYLTMNFILPVKVEDVVEDFRVPVKEELVSLDDVVVAQVQLPAVVCVCGQPANPCLGIPGS